MRRAAEAFVKTHLTLRESLIDCSRFRFREETNCTRPLSRNVQYMKIAVKSNGNIDFIGLMLGEQAPMKD
jgi:hypothetical protein